MAYQNCSSCSDLKEYAPDFVANGVTKSVCTSLKNNTGLGTNADHNDCDDLDDANDCLIGGLGSEIEAYDTCNWKDFMKKFVPNIYNMFKAIICTLCGIWTNIKNLWTKVNKHDCEIEYLYEGTTFNIKETAQTDAAYIVAGKGVSFFLADGSTEHTSDILFRYVAGGLATLSGSCHFYMNSDFNEPSGRQCPNFDLDTSASNDGYRVSNSRKKNPIWGQTGRPATGGELIYEIRLKKSQYPQIDRIFIGRGTEANAGAFTVHFHVFAAGQYAFGQHGWCHDSKHSSPGSPVKTGYSWGHVVPEGWIYVQCRMHWVESMESSDGAEYSPYGWLGMRTNRDKIDC